MTWARASKLLGVVQPLFAVLAFVLLAVLLRHQWDGLRSYQWRVRPAWLLLSTLCLVAAWLLEVRLWQRLLALIGGALPYRTAVRLWFASAIARYVPGNIWQPLSLTMRCHERGIRPEETLASLSLFNVIHVMAVGPIVSVYLATSGGDAALSQWLGSFSRWMSAAASIPVVCFVARPDLFVMAINVVLRQAGREALPLGVTPGQAVRLLGVSLLAWALCAAGFSAFAVATMPPGASVAAALPHLMAAYPIAFAAGFLSLVTPTGLVVREGMVYLMLGAVIGRAQAIVVAVGMRVLELSLEACLSAGALWLPALRQLWRRDRQAS